jgi:C_GCAxxG_C_C family probable redox protein
MESMSITEVRKSAEESFSSGLYCAESVVLAIAKAQGVKSELLPKIATAFCSGMARSCSTCGALTGAVMGVSLVLGRSAPNESVEPAYSAAQQVIRGFEKEFGNRDCLALLEGCDLNTPEGQNTYREKKLGERCLQFVGKAAEMAVQAISEDND